MNNILCNMKIVIWNGTTCKSNYRIDIFTGEFRRFELVLLGVSETHPRGRKHLGGIGFIYSGRNKGVPRQGVRLTMSEGDAKSCLGWESVSNIVLVAHFMTKKYKVSAIVVYTPVELTDGIVVTREI